MVSRNRSACVFLAVIAPILVQASELPDSDVNAVTGSIESVQSFVTNGVTNIRHTIDPGQGAPSISIQLSSNAAEEHSPRIAIRSDGVPGVVWWREGVADTVVLRTRSSATGQSWNEETPLNASGTSSRQPAIVADGATLWVAFETNVAGGRSIEVRAILDDPMPIITIEPLTTHAGDLDTRIHFAQGSLWVTWVDSGANVAWSEYDPVAETWSLPAYESYAADSVSDARERIRTTVTSN